MKLMRWIAMLAAVLTATSAYAQDVTTSGTKPVPASSSGNISGTAPIKVMMIGGASSDTTRWVLPITSDGTGLRISDNSRDRDNTLTQMLFTGTMWTDSTSFNCDSTATPIDVHQYRNLKLVFFIAPQDSVAAGAQRFYRIAYQAREFVNGVTDSTGAAAEYGMPASNYGVLVAGTAAAIGSDSLQFGQITPPTNFNAGSDEQILVVDAHRSMVTPAGQANYNLPRSGLAVPLQWVGSPHQFMKLGVRIRLLKVAAASKRIKYTVWLLGWS